MSTPRKLILTVSAVALLSAVTVAVTNRNKTDQAALQATTTAPATTTSTAIADITTPGSTEPSNATAPLQPGTPTTNPPAPRTDTDQQATPTAAAVATTNPKPTTTASPAANPPSAANQVFAAVYNVNITQTRGGVVQRHITAFAGIPAGTTIPSTSTACTVAGALTCEHRSAFALAPPQNVVLLTCLAPLTYTATIPIIVPGHGPDTLNITVACT